MSKPTTVRVKVKHIRKGVCGNCWSCVVALAMQEATGDSHANVSSDWGLLRLEVWGRSIYAPSEVTRFVHAFDDLGERDQKPTLPRKLPPGLSPFTFELPPATDPEWSERCYRCEEQCPPDELDDEGVCQECLTRGDD